MENVEIAKIKSMLVALGKCPQCGVPWWFKFENAKICSCCGNTVLKTMGQNEAQEFTRKELQLMMHALILASKACPSLTNQQKGDPMSAKDDSVSAGVSSVQQGEQAVLQGALGKCYDDGEQAGTGPGFTQADIDAAVKAASDPLNQQLSDLSAQDALDKQAAIAAKSQGDATVASIQSQLSSLQQKEGVESGIISGLQSSLGVLQGVVAALAGLQAPPAPTPVDPSQPAS